MKKIVYANIIFFVLILCVFIVASFQKHYSPFWSEMPDVRLKYDIYFIGIFGVLFLFSSIGLLSKKIWGYKLTIITDNSLVLLGILPILYMLLYDFNNLLPLLTNDWKILLPGVFISAVSAVFSIFIHRAKSKLCYQGGS